MHPSQKVLLNTTKVREVWQNSVVLCGKTCGLVKKRFPIIHARFPTPSNYYRTEEKVVGDRKSDPPSGTLHHSENHQTLQFSIVLRLHTELSKKSQDHDIFVLCLFFFVRFSAKKVPPESQAPQSRCSCPATTPKALCKFFAKFLRFRLCGLLRKFFKDFGIHQRLFKETGFTSSAFFASFSKILASIKDFLKKQAS